MGQVNVGWMEAADVTAAEWSEGITLTLDGVPDAAHSNDNSRVAWAQATTASLRGLPGQIVPVTSNDVPWVNGLYRVTSAGASSSPLMMVSGVITPPSVVLERLAVGSVHAEWKSFGGIQPGNGGIDFGYYPATMVLPGSVMAPLDTHSSISTGWDIPEGRTAFLQWDTTATTGQLNGAVFEPPEFLAGSPRVQIEVAGRWWTIHGQPPPGVPVRVMNRNIGLELPVRDAKLRVLRFYSDATVATTHEVEVNGASSTATKTAGVNVVYQDSERLLVRWIQGRTLVPSGDRDPYGYVVEVEIRRGMNFVKVFHSSPQGWFVTGTDNGNIFDASPSPVVIGTQVDQIAVMGDGPVSVSSSGGRVGLVGPRLWIVGRDGTTGRSWDSPSVAIRS